MSGGKLTHRLITDLLHYDFATYTRNIIENFDAFLSIFFGLAYPVYAGSTFPITRRHSFCSYASFCLRATFFTSLLIHETWTLTQKEERKLLVTERKVLRKILELVQRGDGAWGVRKNKNVEKLFG